MLLKENSRLGRAFVIFSLSINFSVSAQPDLVASRYAEQILPSDLQELLTVIASDSLEGRETGMQGQKMAAAFISDHFKSIGLEMPVNGSYFQPVPLFSRAPADAYISIGNKRYSNFEHIVYLGFQNTKSELELVIGGDGSDLENEEINLSGKAMLLVKAGRVDYSQVEALEKKGAELVLLCNTESEDDFISFAKRSKDGLVSRPKLEKPKPTTRANRLVFVSPSTVEAITGRPIKDLGEISPDFKNSKSIRIKYKLSSETRTVMTENVLGYLEGSDKKDELVVITAHYDHIGINDEGDGDLINNGADDDGSGTVTVMELAETFAQAKKDGHGPRRSILFMTVTAEEIGLFGSQYYAENPVYPLANTVVDLNIDMIGRTDLTHKDSIDYVYVIGSDKLSSELHLLSEQTNNSCCNLSFDYLYNDVNHPSNLYKRSDHWNFAKYNIPIIFYFDGIHADYHQPSDEIDKIDFVLLTKRAKLIFHTAWEIANRQERLKID